MKRPNSTRLLSGLVLLIFSVLIISCASFPKQGQLSRPAAEICLPAFPDKDGWYGGDGAYSIKLDDKRVLWLFGDTFAEAQAGRKDRVHMDVILGTTSATSECTVDNEFQIRYWLKKKDGQFVSSFSDKEWLWPQDPFMVANTLYIPLISIRLNLEIEGPFKFEIGGHKLGRIRDFSNADPNRWAVEYLDMTPGIPAEVKAFATTSVVHGGYVYFYPLYSAIKGNTGVLGNILARIPIDRIDNPAAAITYLHKDGQWGKDVNPENVKVVLEASVSELSVRRHDTDGKWVAVYMSLNNNGDQMLYQTADSPEGPWSAPKVLIASIPEVTPDSDRYDKNNFCYAGKEHRQFSRGRNLVATYVCNSYEDIENNRSFIRRNLFLYRPVVNNINF